MAQLECKNLTLGYGSKTVIENLSFSVNKGDYLCIVGENGSGKTTLMKTILRLLKPLSGTIETGDGLLPDDVVHVLHQLPVRSGFPFPVADKGPELELLHVPAVVHDDDLGGSVHAVEDPAPALEEKLLFILVLGLVIRVL